MHTHAYHNFRDLMRQQSDFIRIVAQSLVSDARRLRREDRKAKTGTIITLDAERKSFNRSLRVIQNSDFAMKWTTVMIVTATESYLQDALAECADRDPSIMSESQQHADYDEVARASSIQELAAELRRRWARNFIDRGGPATWIERLHRMGARGFPSDTAPVLERLWGIRHLVVHSAGRITNDFVRRHGGSPSEVGERIVIEIEELSRYFGAAKRFVSTTDDFLIRRFFEPRYTHS